MPLPYPIPVQPKDPIVPLPEFPVTENKYRIPTYNEIDFENLAARNQWTPPRSGGGSQPNPNQEAIDLLNQPLITIDPPQPPKVTRRPPTLPNSFIDPYAGLGVLAAGALYGRQFSSGSGASGSRDYAGEIGSILSMQPGAAAQNYALQSAYNPALTQLGYENFAATMGQLPGTMRGAYDAANPGQAAHLAGMPGAMADLNASQPGWMDATGYNAANAGRGMQAGMNYARFDPQAARFAGAGGGPLLGRMEGDAGDWLGRVTGLQQQQKYIAQDLLGAGGGLTAGELAGVQDSARAAYSDRGMLRSNRGIGAEILQTDAAQRNRLVQNMGIAQQVDASDVAQRQANRNYAMGVQNQGQNLSQFNSGQRNAMNQFNTGQANSIGANLAQFNAGQANQMGQFNAGQYNSMAQFNATAEDRAGQFNAGATNTMNQFNQQMRFNNNDAAWQRQMGLGGLYQQNAINPSAVAMGLQQQIPDYTNALLGYGQDVFSTNANAAAAAANSKSNNNAAITAAGLNMLANMYGSWGG
jgi:hypothetical protein